MGPQTWNSVQVCHGFVQYFKNHNPKLASILHQVGDSVRYNRSILRTEYTTRFGPIIP